MRQPTTTTLNAHTLYMVMLDLLDALTVLDREDWDAFHARYLIVRRHYLAVTAQAR